ncbi:lysine N(6)-hydroxylase/L-ornithine N(5)-oxygenase family protein [Arthrobacter rhombi]|uniref:lysine N(6)-hydroxylase/L-ornithine N(5)-oxygenase family protein n=1 Tax=Arthrobacter rhombi TaxID=71253 RepID=UPI0031D624DA
MHTANTTANDRILDAVGIGAGPFNLGFAALAENVPGLDILVLEAAPELAWHPGMMLEGTHLQVPFMADLVTLADPTNRHSFLNYLKESGRIYPFYIREDFYALRAEYNNYLRWAAERLASVRFGQRVVSASFEAGVYTLEVEHDGGTSQVRTRRLVLGTGTTPEVPPAARDALSAARTGDTAPLVHSSTYRTDRDRLRSRRRLAVVGSGQSAAEVFADLLGGLGDDQELLWITRSPRFFPLEYTKLTLEMTSPEYIDHFHSMPQERRDLLNATQKSLFKGINADLINEIHEMLYRRSVEGAPPVRLLAATSLESLEQDGGRWQLGLRNQDDGGTQVIGVDAAVLATGYSYREPSFLAGIADRLERLPDGRLDVDRHYSVGVAGDILVQNAELHTHGFTAPDLGMGAYRNAVIINRITGVEHYAVERRIAFQEFGTPGTPGNPSPTPSATPLQEATA